MKTALAVIDRIIEEHGIITQNINGLERTVNDTGVLEGLAHAEDIAIDKQSLTGLLELLQTLTKRLNGHFNFEETGLMAAFQKYGDRSLTSTFSALLLEHENLRNQFARASQGVSELIDGELTPPLWASRAPDMRAQVNLARQLLAVHIGNEKRLLEELRRRLLR